ncbi:hypothetical protein HOD02_02555 [bacterium]|jgi:hypothetical protein|nr:hypothetical protein [bacterium]
MSSILDSQKTQSVIGLANLAQNKEISNGIARLEKTTAEQNKHAKERNRLVALNNKIQEMRVKAENDTKKAIKLANEYQRNRDLQEDMRETEKKLKAQELAIKRDVLFGVTQDLESTLESIMDEVERFYKLNALAHSLKEQKIDRASLESMDDKKMLHDTAEDLQSAIMKSYDEMSKEQIEDVKTINKVLSVDEERTIEKLISKISEFEAFRENISNAREKISSPDERSKVWIKKALHDIGIKPSIRLSMKAIENEKEEKT